MSASHSRQPPVAPVKDVDQPHSGPLPAPPVADPPPASAPADLSVRLPSEVWIG